MLRVKAGSAVKTLPPLGVFLSDEARIAIVTRAQTLMVLYGWQMEDAVRRAMMEAVAE